MASPVVLGRAGAKGPIVIFLHGLGDSGAGLAGVAEMVLRAKGAEDQTWIMPTAPSRPVTIAGGQRTNAWYDIVSLSSRDVNTMTGLSDSCDQIAQLASKMRGDRPLFVGGFSQGGAVAIEAVYSGRIQNCRGVIGLSTYCVGKLSESSDAPPLLMMHGTDDDVVKHDWARASFDKLTKGNRLQTKAVFKSVPRLTHTINQYVIDEVFRFIIDKQ